MTKLLAARRQRMAAEMRKIEELAPGAVYTLALLGIHSGEERADSTPTALALPEYSGCFGLGHALDFGPEGNAGLVPNGNGRLQAFLGLVNGTQARMALALGEAARVRGLRLHVVAHSNGVNAAAAFLRRFGGVVENAVIIAPNTRQAGTMHTIAERAEEFTLLLSDFDERLKQAWLGHRPVAFWKKVLPAGRVVESEQSGHGAQCYLLAHH